MLNEAVVRDFYSRLRPLPDYARRRKASAFRLSSVMTQLSFHARWLPRRYEAAASADELQSALCVIQRLDRVH